VQGSNPFNGGSLVSGSNTIGASGVSKGPPNNGDMAGASPSAQKGQVTPADILPESKPFDDVSTDYSEQKRLSQLFAIVNTVNTRFQRAKETRRPQEIIWLRNIHQWRGEYNEDEKSRIAVAKARSKEASDIFIKITKTKTTAAIGQIEEILFQGNKFPLEIIVPNKPDGIAKEAFVVPEQFPIDDIYGYKGDGKTLNPGDTRNTLLGGVAERFKNLLQGKKLEEGPSPDPKQFPQINPAEMAAKEMQFTILDQIAEGKVEDEIRKSVWECVLQGTGVLKGPMTYDKITHSWKKVDGKNTYSPETKPFPKASYVSIWNFYPDPNCTRVENAAYICEKHLMTAWQIADLKNYEGFDANAIERVLRNRPIRTRDYWENQIKDISVTVSDERYDVIEYWGYLEREHLEGLPTVEQDELAKLTNQAQVNVWIANGEVLL